MLRRAFLAGTLALALPGAVGAATLTLRTEPGIVPYGGTVTFAGVLAPAQPGVPVAVYVQAGSTWQLVTQGATQPDGSYRLAALARYAARAYAVAQLDAATQVASPQAVLGMRPRLEARVRGGRAVGERLVLTGSLLPAGAGRLMLKLGKETSRVRPGARGNFRLVLPATLPGRVRWSLFLAPKTGYAAVRVARSFLVSGSNLALGSSGSAVRGLEARLDDLHYVLRGVDSYYGYDTYEAVLAFQKVHGMRRTGRVGADLWRRLVRADVPRAFSPSGTHIEVSKTKQVMFEVVRGKVASVVHVSTGATGNTPVGSWRVYRLGPGGSLNHMYYSIYFLRGFAIHGYHSVPPWPASHGCVRTPLWFAPGFYARWGKIGTRILVYP
ncbi:MAG: peptidoglycan-binding protein [Actinobacteria bacterium]|nr:peptidoglycan-binding protein [Actinomycetota bacterium]